MHSRQLAPLKAVMGSPKQGTLWARSARVPNAHFLSSQLSSRYFKNSLAESNWKIWACFSLQSITVFSTVKSTQMLLSLAPARAQTQGLPMAVATSSLPCGQQVTSHSTRAVLNDHTKYLHWRLTAQVHPMLTSGTQTSSSLPAPPPPTDGHS